MPKVSILVPIYNVEKYLRECLESLINQTLDDIEIICINDGSTDDSTKILEEYKLKDKRITIINKENTGYGHSMNIGLDNANGEYIGIVEPDDYAKNTMFEDLYNLAHKNESDIVKSEYCGFTSQGDKKQQKKTESFARFKKYKNISLKDCPELIRKPPSIWSAIYKREFITKHNIRFLETPGASFQDTSFSFKTLCLANKILLTPKSYIFYRQDNENSSVNSKDKIFAICKEYNEITEFLNKYAEIKKFINTQKLIKQYNTYIWNLKRIDELLQQDFIEDFSSTFKSYYDKNEIDDVFFKKINKKEFLVLISDPKAFKDRITKKLAKQKIVDKGRKLFSIRISSSGLSIVMFGKKIMEIG